VKSGRSSGSGCLQRRTHLPRPCRKVLGFSGLVLAEIRCRSWGRFARPLDHPSP
jgi:hypothetical protein